MIQYFSRKQLVKAGLLVLVTVMGKTMVAQPGPYPPSVPVNYIRTYDAVAPETDVNTLMGRPAKDVKVATQYFDGLGRPVQTVMKQASLETGGTLADMVSPVEYDDLGREQNKYLPFAANGAGGNTSVSDGLFKRNPFQQQTSFMTEQYGLQGETFFYSKTNFETSPLNRAEKNMPPGNSWVGSNRGVEMKYFHNTTGTDKDNVKVWKVENVSGSFGTYTINTSYNAGTYPAGQLYKTITVDEQGKQVIEFKDKEGKVILKKVQLTAAADDGTGKEHTGWLSTYYIYDKLGNLRCVIQPEGVRKMTVDGWALTGTLLNEQCFRYEYDERSRMIMKKVPGAEAVYMVYDRWDRLILTQDGNQRLTNSWIFTKYDEQNRPILTGLHGDPTNNSLAAMIAHVKANEGWQIRYESINTGMPYGYTTTQTYPYGSSPTILTATHYDDYTGLPGGLSGSYLTTWNSYLEAQSNTVWPYPQTPQHSLATKGMVTWTQTNVLGSTTMLTTVMIYDDKGRVIQAKATNITGGTDVTTTQYTWAGQPLVTVQKQEKGEGTTQQHIVVTKMQYDDLGRVLTIKKTVNSTIGGVAVNKAEQLIAANKYDKLGQLKEKQLGAGSGTPLFEKGGQLKYDYNIRGWMLGMNRDYLVNTGQSGTATFGFELGYDKQSSNSGRPFIATQYNGNITGMIWKSDGDDVKRKYDFSYDAANRLMKGQFEQDDAINSWNATTMNYAMQMGDGSDPLSAYDANGNIKGMTQYGWKLGGNVNTPIDNLAYNYIAGSNKLLNVIDASNDPLTKLGDFRTSSLHPGGTKTATTVDYTYDANGNLKKDLNKDIGTESAEGIVYNHLNLPQSITLRKTGGAVKGTITYTYDAAGNKLKKEVAETGLPTKTTMYLGGTVYENDVLQFIGHEEGRIRYKAAEGANPADLHYDYMIKDHLGNVRMVLTEEQKTDAYPPASMETAQATTEEALYANLPGTRTPINTITDYPNDTYTSPNAWVARVKAAAGSQKIGPSITLRVMAGDKFNLRVSSWYKTNGASPGSPVSPLNDIVAALAGGIGGISGGHGGATATEITNSGLLPAGVNGFFTTQPNDPNRPKAHINWILFDEQFKFVSSSSGAEQVPVETAFGTAPNQIVYPHVKDNLPINKNGYLYVYVSNETPNIDVFFDNLQVTHIRGPVLEETHYYPFGLTMAGISSKALLFGNPENKKKFNGIEHTTEFDLHTYDAFFRNADPQIGRWWQIDPKPNMTESPYIMMGNNPLSKNDPLGDTAIVRWRRGGQHSEARYVGGQWIDSKTREAIDVDKVSKKARRIMNDYTGLNQNSDFDPVTDKINNNPINVVLSNAKNAETDPNRAFLSGKSKELTVNLSKSAKMKADLNVGNVKVRLNSQQVMGHELGHVFDILNGKPGLYFETIKKEVFGYGALQIALSETNAMYWENILRAQAGLPLRRYYFYSRNSRINWSNGDAIIKYDPKTGQPTSIADYDGNTYIIK
ncbi:MAG: hypothetical protein JNM19_01945 [Chitinophagaceae bacterium]|nr:hypothetical protein [Chitinophagaceae bacterium]